MSVDEADTGTESTTRLCGRPTRSGSPCRIPMHGPPEQARACRAHWTEHDTEVADAYRAGQKRGQEWERGSVALHISNLEKQIEKLQQQLDGVNEKRRHMTDASGRQIIQVTGGYSYIWSGETPLQVGDTVRLPPNWVSRSGWTAEVTALGTLYDGPLDTVVRQVTDDDD